MNWFAALLAMVFGSSPSTPEMEVTGTENEFPESEFPEDYVDYDEYMDDDLMGDL